MVGFPFGLGNLVISNLSTDGKMFLVTDGRKQRQMQLMAVFA